MTKADQRRYDFADCWSGRFGNRLYDAARMFRPLPGWVPTLNTLLTVASKATKHGSPVGGSRRQDRANRRKAMQRARKWSKYADRHGIAF